MRSVSRRRLIKSLAGTAASVCAYTASETGTLGSDGALRISESAGLIEIDNGLVKARFTRQSVGVRQEFFAKDGQGGWTKLVMAFNPPVPRPQGTAPLYGDTGVAHEYRLLTAEAFKAMTVGKGLEKEVIVSLSGMIGNNQVEQKVSLNAGLDHFHIQVHATLAGALARLEYLLSCFVFGAGSPDFTHVPCLKRAADDVVADRIFNAPAIIIQKGRLLAALVPDLDSINQNIVYARGARTVDGPRGFRLPEDPAKISMPTIMDLDLRSGMTPDPLFSFGFADYIIEQHMFWRHENRGGSMARELSARDVRYGFDLFLSADAPPQRGYQKISRYIWKRYGSRFLEQPRPQAMPFAEYAKQSYPAAFAYKGDSSRDTKRYSEKLPYDTADSGPLPTWLEFDFEGRPAGGIRATPTQWYNDIQFTPWWNCVRDAVGMYWWGKQGSPDLVGKARRIVNLALAAPQDQGVFPSIFRYTEKRWYGCYWNFPADFRMDWIFPSGWKPRTIPTNFWNTSSELYQTAAASKTGVYLLRYRSECEDDPRILPYVRRYGDFLVSRLEKNGGLPAFFARDLKPVRELNFNAEGGIHIGLLCELYKSTREKKYLDAAESAAAFLNKEILPQQRWFDFETFYSCSIKPENFFDQYTGQWPQSTLSMLWAIDGFASLYEVTGNREYLENAEAVADYSQFYQAAWQPHFVITAYAFGGFRSQNSDAEWLDMRQSLFGESLVRLGLLTGRQDLLERGVAAARAAFTIIDHPRHIKNGIFRFPRYPVGIEPENIDHEGLPQDPLRSGFDWGEGGALAAAATLMGLLGGVYIDFRRNIGVGVDGVWVKSFQQAGNQIRLELINQLARLPYAYNSPYPTRLRLDGLPQGRYELVVNGANPRSIVMPAPRGFEYEVSPNLLRR